MNEEKKESIDYLVEKLGIMFERILLEKEMDRGPLQGDALIKQMKKDPDHYID